MPIIEETMQIIKDAGKLPTAKIIEKIVYAKCQQLTWLVYVQSGQVNYYCRVFNKFEKTLYDLK